MAVEAKLVHDLEPDKVVADSGEAVAVCFVVHDETAVVQLLKFRNFNPTCAVRAALVHYIAALRFAGTDLHDLDMAPQRGSS